MSVFENMLGNWIQIIDDQNDITIENYRYDTGIIEGTTANHCIKCVAVNKCWFKNEKNKKPEKSDITGINLSDSILKGLLPKLYHFGCHCKEIPIAPTNFEEIELIVPNGKIPYLFKSKSDWVNAMGYHESDYNTFIYVLFDKTKQAYFYGKYYIEDITKYGCKINLMIDIPGANEKLGKTYKLKSNYMVFPNGKLKMNTPIGGWQK